MLLNRFDAQFGSPNIGYINLLILSSPSWPASQRRHPTPLAPASGSVGVYLGGNLGTAPGDWLNHPFRRQHKSLRNLIEAIPEEDWTPIPYWMDGAAAVAKTTYIPFQSEPDAAPVRLIVRRVKPTPGSQLALFASYSYHGFITDRDGETLCNRAKVTRGSHGFRMKMAELRAHNVV